MADERICGAGVTLAPFTVGPYNDFRLLIKAELRNSRQIG